MRHAARFKQLLLGMTFGASLAGIAPALADPGPACTLTTPTANATCGVITMSIVGRTNNLDPAGGGPNTDYMPAYPQQGMLYRQDRYMVPRMDLIEAEVVAPDGLTITQTLKKTAQYSDGSPVLAEDAVLAYDRWKASGISSAYVAKIVAAKADGADKIVWTLSTPYPDFKYALASQFMGIHPKKQIDAKGPVEYFKKPVSAGPLMLSDWTPGTDTMVLKANPHYWAKPDVQELRIIVIPDGTSALLALQQGAIDYVYTLPLSSKAQADPAKVNVFAHPELGTFMLSTNNYAGQPNAALKDKRVRQAMSLVIDRDKMARIAFFGIPERACAYSGKAGNPYFACSLPNEGKPDLAAAKARLAETPFAKGFEFEMIVPARPQWAEAAQVIAADLLKIGITANVKPLPDAEISARIRARNYEMVFFRNAAATAILTLQNWFSPGGAWSVNTGFADPVAAGLLNEAASTTDVAKIKELLLKVEKMGVEDATYIPLTSNFSLSGLRYPSGVVEVVTPGDWLYVKTTPGLPGG